MSAGFEEADDGLFKDGGGFDTMPGELGNDRLGEGSAEAIDLLVGRKGNDMLVNGNACDGAIGDSTLVGGGGADDFVVVPGWEFQIDDLAEEDRVRWAQRLRPLVSQVKRSSLSLSLLRERERVTGKDSTEA